MILEIAFGIWIGGLLLTFTLLTYVEIHKAVEKRLHSASVRGDPWWTDFLPVKWRH